MRTSLCVLLRVRGCLFVVFKSVFVCWHARTEKKIRLSEAF